MSHGHSHGGHGHSHGGGHGHSHGGKQQQGPTGLSEAKMNGMFDDDQTLRQHQRMPPSDPQTLEEACESGSLSTAIMCVARGTKVDRSDDAVGATPMHWAALRGHMAILRFLVDQKADVNVKDSRGQTPLFWAITENKLEAANFLLEQGADPHADDQRGCDAYSVACQHGSLAMLHLLHTFHKIDITEADDDNHNCFVWACYKGHLGLAHYLYYVHKMPHNVPDDRRRTALHWAAREGHTEICVWLVSIGLNPAQQDAEGLTPMHWARKHNHYLCQRYLERGYKAVPDKKFGTLASLTKEWFYPATVATSIGYLLGGYFLITRYVPAVFAYSLMGSFGAKGLGINAMVGTPIRNSIPEPSLAESLGMPKNAEEAFRGTDFMNYRDPGIVVVWLGALLVQCVAMHVAGAEPSQLYMAATATLLLAFTVSKTSAFDGFVAKQSVEDDPILKAVERKEFDDCRWTRIYRTAHHIRVPLRAFHSKELDTVIHEYDGWSLLLDAPVSRANRRSYLVMLMAWLVQQVALFFSAWKFLSAKHCDPAQEFSLMRTAFNLFVSNTPCRVKFPDDSYLHYVVPQPDNQLGFWALAMAFVLGCGAFMYLYREFQALVHGCSTLELIHQTMPSTDGGLTSIFRNGRCVFSQGNGFRNIAAFFAGTLGQQWRGASAIPPPQKGGNCVPKAAAGGCGCSH